jgi:O-antigen ligase
MRVFFYSVFVFFVLWVSFIPQPVYVYCDFYSKVFLALLFLILLIHKNKMSMRFLFRRDDIFLWLFLGWQIFSVLFAYNKQIAWHRYVDFTMPFIFLYFVFREELDPGKVRVILFTLFFSGVAVSIIGILEFILNKNIIYEYFVKNVFYARYLAESRVMSTMMSPVITGTYLMSCLPTSYYVIGALNGKIKRLFAMLGMAIIIICLILTFTRASWLSALIVAILYILRKNVKLILVLVISCFLIYLCLIAAFKIRPVLADRVGYKQSISYLLEGHRRERYPITFSMVKDHPIAGVGLNNYRIVFDGYYGRKDVPEEFKIPDNMYLMIMGESGLVGFGLFIIFIFAVLKKALSGMRNKKCLYPELALVFFLMLTGILIHMASYDLFYWFTPFFLFLFSIAGLSWVSNYEKS